MKKAKEKMKQLKATAAAKAPAVTSTFGKKAPSINLWEAVYFANIYKARLRFETVTGQV